MSSVLIFAAAVILAASDLDEFRVKREAVFEFAKKPQVTRQADRVTIAFETKGFCDVTVAIEDANGKIVRHLASGVLGPNAPEPFQKNAKKQTVVWDGKNDQGVYIDDKDHITIRVSLGLRARLERSLYWSPYKRYGELPIICAAPDGIYLFDGVGVDGLRFFNHKGDYVRTIYPFPANTLKDVKGLRWHDFPQGYRRPLKESLYQQTLLTSGDNDSIDDRLGMSGRAAVGMAVHGTRIALAFEHLNRLQADGSTGGLPLKGPKTGVVIQKTGYGGYDRGAQVIGPTSMAFAPDGRTMYLTGYLWRPRGREGCLHVLYKMDYETDAAPRVIVGNTKGRDGHGTDNKSFAVPTSVDVDAKGRVYVSDFLNDRVQVFDGDGAHLKTIKTTKPAKVLVHKRTGEIYILSWSVMGVPYELHRTLKFDRREVKQTVTRFSPLPEAKRLSVDPITLGQGEATGVFMMGQVYHVELDSWVDEPTLWVVGRKHTTSRADLRANRGAFWNLEERRDWSAGVRCLQRREEAWRLVRAFGRDTIRAVVRPQPPANAIQELYFNPGNGLLYLGEADSAPTTKAFKQLLVIDPETGRITKLDLPFNALDLAFDQQGIAYLRSTNVVARYDSATWKEKPWDYGMQMERVTSGGRGRAAPVVAGLRLPARSPVCFHQGGMHVSAKGHLVVACHIRASRKHHIDFGEAALDYATDYKPTLYPGREESSTSCGLHVWDERGRVLYEDAVPGMPQINGVFLDAKDNLYVMATPWRYLDGKPYFNEMSSTLMKFAPGRGKILTGGRAPVPLPESDRPKRTPDVKGRWVEGAEWYYGGVGFAGFNTAHAGGGCACWHGRFVLDYFARSFAPEPYQYSVAVLDSSGNLIMRIGRPGNVDDGMPLIRNGGPPDPRSIGGDEVALFHPNYVGTDTDHRLFISDVGNGRILSVTLDYQTSERLALKDVPETNQ